MSTSYSTNLALALPATGELSGTWGTTVNTNITNMLDEALGYQAYSATGGTDTITIPDGTTGVARSIYIQLNGTGGGSVAVPATKTKMYFVFNNTASAITFKVTGQTGVSIPAAAKMALVSNGTDVIVAQNYFAALTLGAALPVLSGGTGVTTSTGTGSVVLNTSPTLVTPALGTPSSGVVTNLTGTASININGTVGATTPTTGAFTSVTINNTGNGSTILATGSTGSAVNQNMVLSHSPGGGAYSYTSLQISGVDVFGAGRLLSSYTGNAIVNATDSTGSVLLKVDGTTKATITSTGLNSTVIGATTPAAGSFTTLSVLAGSSTNGIAVQNTNDSNYFYTGTNSSNTEVFRVAGSGNVLNTNNSYGALSDAKLKENIVDASAKLADLMQVKVRNYNLIGETTKQIGVVAQELETVFPSMVDENADRDEDGNLLETTTKGVKYSVFVPMLIKAMQEQQAIIESLKARLDAANL